MLMPVVHTVPQEATEREGSKAMRGSENTEEAFTNDPPCPCAIDGRDKREDLDEQETTGNTLEQEG